MTCLRRLLLTLFTFWWMDWTFSLTYKIEYSSFFSFLDYVKRITNCSDRILTSGIKSIRSPVKGGTGCYRLLITSPVVSWRGWETPPPAPQFNCPSLLDHGWVKTSCCVWTAFVNVCLHLVEYILVSSTLTKMSIIFFLIFLLAMSYFIFTYVRGLVTPPNFLV